MPDALLLPLAVVGAAGAAALSVPALGDRRLRRMAGRPPRLTHQVQRLAAALAALSGRGALGRRRQREQRAGVIRAVAALAAELEAGQVPGTALARAGGDHPPWPAALSAVGGHGDIAEALARDGEKVPLLRQLGACWRVGESTGAGLAASVSRLAASARAAEEVRAVLEGQLAVPRATARMLAGLPVLGVAFGVLLGADPIGWLTMSPAGRVCLLGGVALTLVGLWWTGRIAAAVERRL